MKMLYLCLMPSITDLLLVAILIFTIMNYLRCKKNEPSDDSEAIDSLVKRIDAVISSLKNTV